MMGILLSTLLLTSSAAGDYVFVCKEKPAEAPSTDAKIQEPKQFLISFSIKGTKIKNISVDDPQNILDPLGKLPVYSGGTSRNGALTITKSEPPKQKPLKLKGKIVGGEMVFVSRKPDLTLTMRNDSDGYEEGFPYSFSGNRLLSGSFHAAYEGEGLCGADNQNSDEISK